MNTIKTLFLMLLNVISSMPFRILELIGNLLPNNSVGCKLRGRLYKSFFKSCGKNFQVSQNVKLENMKNIVVGNDVYIGYSCWINGI